METPVIQAAEEANVWDIVVRSVLGGLIIALILTLARFQLYKLSGLLVSVPVVSLYTFWWIGREHGGEQMRVAIYAALWSAIPWALYLLVAYLLVGRMSNWMALGAGVVTYLAVSGLVWVMLRQVG